MKFLILVLLLLPVFAQAETVMYTMKDGETIEDVRKDFAKEYNVPAESFWIWDDEFNPKQLYIDVPSKELPIEATDVELFEVEVVEDERVALMNQIIKLLMEIIRLQNEQKL